MTTHLTDSDANRLLATAVANIQCDYPVHWMHFVHAPEDLRTQRERHPIFAGSFDWHSCVHQTWLIARLLRLRPQLPAADSARAALAELITEEGSATEAEFFASPDGKYWERPYGWAWLLVLDAELRSWAHASASGGSASGGSVVGGSVEVQRWAKTLRPIAEVLRRNWLVWLANARWPTRVGQHTNTALAGALILDAARATGDAELADSVTSAARRWYLEDKDYGGFEPDAADFLSPILVEIDLMRRVLPATKFATWLHRLLPDLTAPRWSVLREPVEVTDPTDPYGSHLAGLALSRSWCWRGLASALPATDPFTTVAEDAAQRHQEMGWRYLFDSGYAAEHWLGTFAVYLNLGAFDTP